MLLNPASRKLFSALENQNKWLLFLLWTLITSGAAWMTQYALDFDQLLYNNLSEQLSAERINQLLEHQKKWQWLGYLFLPLSLIVKWALTAIPFYIGGIFYEIKLSYKQAFHIVLQSEPVFILAILTKISWLYFQKDGITLEYVQFFAPLSLINWFDVNEIDVWFIYPLQTLNLFEVGYWLLLAHFFKKEFEGSFEKAVEFVLTTYGIGLLIWVVFMSFIALNFS